MEKDQSYMRLYKSAYKLEALATMTKALEGQNDCEDSKLGLEIMLAELSGELLDLAESMELKEAPFYAKTGPSGVIG